MQLLMIGFLKVLFSFDLFVPSYRHFHLDWLALCGYGFPARLCFSDFGIEDWICELSTGPKTSSEAPVDVDAKASSSPVTSSSAIPVSTSSSPASSSSSVTSASTSHRKTGGHLSRSGMTKQPTVANFFQL